MTTCSAPCEARPTPLDNSDRLDAQLPDGGRIALRQLRNGEQEPMREMFEGLSPHSRFLRFFSPMPRLTASMLTQLTNLDGRDRVAWGAFDSDGHCLAIAQYVRLGDGADAAEMAAAVIDRYHRRGLAGLMLELLAVHAHTMGLRQFTYAVHPENGPCRALIRSIGGRLRLRDGAYEGAVSVPLGDRRLRRSRLSSHHVLASLTGPRIPQPRSAT